MWPRAAAPGDPRKVSTLVPSQVRYLVVGAGIHGLSTAWHLARELKARNLGGGRDVLVIDKKSVGAGASGIACGVIRNNYFQPAMRGLMAHSVSIWESYRQTLSYHPVGYVQVAPENMHEDVVQIYEQQRDIGYDSVLVEGVDAVESYMRDLFPDWQARDLAVVLHEKKGGYANNTQSLQGLRKLAEHEGVRIQTGVRVTGINLDGGAVSSVETDRGRISCEQVVFGVGPWIPNVWSMLELPEKVEFAGPDGQLVQQPMWTYWALQEGTLEVDPYTFKDSAGGFPPVIHVDSTCPLYDDVDGGLITDKMWGLYYRPDFHFGGVQGGTAPYLVARDARDVAVDPYGTPSREFVVDDGFVRMWTSGLAHCHKRFEEQRSLYRRTPSGGIGAFTPDSFPVFDTFRQNAHVIADANHGYKMIGVGALVAKEVLGDRQSLLEPFRFDRYAQGELHPTSNSPFPWS